MKLVSENGRVAYNVAEAQGMTPIAKIAIAISISIFIKFEIAIAISIAITKKIDCS